MKNKLCIPSSFELLGVTYTVEFEDDLIGRTDNVGEADYRYRKIRLQSLKAGVPINSEKQEQTYLHEVTHHILEIMGSKLKNDEQFIELFAGLLHQALVTSVYGEAQ